MCFDCRRSIDETDGAEHCGDPLYSQRKRPALETDRACLDEQKLNYRWLERIEGQKLY
jgi:hypothetical protein